MFITAIWMPKVVVSVESCSLFFLTIFLFFFLFVLFWMEDSSCRLWLREFDFNGDGSWRWRHDATANFSFLPVEGFSCHVTSSGLTINWRAITLAICNGKLNGKDTVQFNLYILNGIGVAANDELFVMKTSRVSCLVRSNNKRWEFASSGCQSRTERSILFVLRIQTEVAINSEIEVIFKLTWTGVELISDSSWQSGQRRDREEQTHRRGRGYTLNWERGRNNSDCRVEFDRGIT